MTQLNAALEHVAASAGAHFLDLWPTLEGDDGTLRAEYTLDGLHLTGAGYRAWVEVLRPVVASAVR